MAHFLAPTLIDPILDVGFNKKFSGAPVHPEQRGYGPTMPASSQSFRNTSPASKWLAEVLNDISGGDLGKPGVIDIHPESIGHFVEFALGGAGRVVWRTGKGGLSLIGVTDDDLTLNDVPITRRFLGSAPEWMITRDFYDAAEEVEQSKANLEEYKLSLIHI